MRLLKLLVYAALGYVIYELYQGMTSEGGGGGGGRGRGGGGGGARDQSESSRLSNALNRDQGRMRMTGPGRGQLLTTEDDSGASTPHMVGRGAVQP